MDKIDPLKQKVRELDRQLLAALEERFKTVQEIWKIKLQWGIAPRDETEQRLVEELEINSNLSPILIENLYALIFQENETRLRELESRPL